ncbi:MAG: helix-hairpin-helix domain-containing protein [Syntrophothermus sp.]
MPNKTEIIILLEGIADLMEFLGENTFKVKAYRNGSEAIRKSDVDFNLICEQKKLDSLKGIGKGLQSVIYEYCENGSSTLYNQLKDEVPDGIEELLNIRGLGAKKIFFLYQNLKIKTIDELEEACLNDRLLEVKGFGEKTQQKILNEIEKFKKNKHYILLSSAINYSDDVLSKLNDIKSIRKKELSGSLRRGMEVISEIEVVVLTKDIQGLSEELKYFYAFEQEEEIITIPNYYPLPVKLYLAKSESQFNLALFISTGSKEFLSKQEFVLNLDNVKSENEIFESNNIPYVIPSMREQEYLEAKKEFTKNSDLNIEGYKGLLHFHTEYSDGRYSIEEMVTSARDMGCEYAFVCDHSKAAFYANGLNEERILLQSKEIKEISKKINFPIYQGIECDILKDGALDFADEVLAQLNFTVVSVHSVFTLDEREMTKRIIKAVENPYADILAHPTGRLLLYREPYKINIKKVIDACAANQVAVEINSSPNRLDLDWRNIYYAREKGCLFSINSDAHLLSELPFINYGIMMGKKGGLMKEEVINYYDLPKFKTFCNRKVRKIK